MARRKNNKVSAVSCHGPFSACSPLALSTTIVSFMDLLILLAARLLEGMFVIGLIGSAGVLLVSFVEDAETLFDMEDKGHS